MTMSKGEAAFDTPTLQCQDFMSPTDCAWLFNVCDPVICPSSRCDMGGSAPRANVIQSGIIGSLLLCLPNFGNPAEGKVVIPVCLSGLKAGIDGYLSIVKAHRDCLIEKQATGKNVGICDEVYSIYLCDLFWKEAGSFKDIIIPKILDFFSGRSPTRGGGEYLGAEAAWTNAKASVDYFTKSYASNSYEAFKVQGVNDIKESVCKNSLSAAFPEIAALESMTEPSSPPQFHAKFDESPFTDATVPPTSQYSVFYTIFAGNSDGVNFQVYLKSPEGQSIYSINPTYFVAGGYIAVGQTASEKKDFIAPSGYRELCVRVNAQEECGFKEVSTSFAVDWVTDKIVSNEATTSGIKTEAECTSGTQFNSAALANTNLGAGASNFVSPDLYASGITRICSSIPPDGNNQSTKWKLVGYCDDTNIKCWIDTSSVKDAIEISGIQGDTLSQIGKNALDLSLPENTKTMDEFNNLIDGLKRDLVLKDKLAGIPGMVDDNINNVLFDWQKVQLMYVKAQAYDQLARIENGFASAYVTPASSSSSTSSSSTSTGGGTSASDTTISSGGTATTGTNTASATQTIDATSTATVPTPNLNLDNTGFFVGDGKVTQATDKDNIEFRVSATGCDIIQYSILKDRFWIFDGKISNLENLRDVSKYLSLPVEKYIVKQIKCLDISGKEIFNIPKDFEKGWKLEVVSGPIIATSTSS